MSKYRNALHAQWRRRLFLTDGGLETTLIFHRGLDLPHLRRLRPLADREESRNPAPVLRPLISKPRGVSGFEFRARWAHLARQLRLEAASRLFEEALAAVNEDGTALLEELRNAYEEPGFTIIIAVRSAREATATIRGRS